MFINYCSGISRFAWFGSLCSLCSHGSISEMRTLPGSVLKVRFQKSRIKTCSAITVRFLIARIRHRTARTVRMVHTVWLQTSYVKLVEVEIFIIDFIDILLFSFIVSLLAYVYFLRGGLRMQCTPCTSDTPV